MPATRLVEGRNLSAPVPDADDSHVLAFGPRLAAPGYLGTRAEIEDELDQLAAAIRIFYLKQPDQVMRECAAYTARLTELCVLLHRVEGQDRHYTRIRTQQVERFLTELDRQFRIASRIVEINRQDLSMAGAQT